ncbi:MAG: EAL domain-containing protein [Spirochaetales bacterium]|nr:EAL domain-containing protein [Spirochaetales bacterium]
MDKAYKYIVDVSPDFITLINKEYIYEVVNASYANVLEMNVQNIVGKSVAEIWTKEKFDQILKSYLDRCFKGEEIHYIDEFHFGLSVKYMHVSYYPYRGDGNEVTHALVFSHDITKIGQMESKLANYEFRDPVTGLFNKKSLDLLLDMELDKAARSVSEKLRGICIIRIFNLREIRDKHGNEIANILLENSGIRVKQCLRTSDHVCRSEGSELVVVLTRLSNLVDIAKVAAKLYDSIATPYRHEGVDIVLKPVIGAAIYPNDGKDRESLISRATSALLEARNAERDFMLFDNSIQERARYRMQMEKDLYTALYEKQFELYYQPIVDTKGVITGAEALIRWHHPEKGFIPPAEFIPVAEQTGIIDEIGKWVLFSASRQLEQWVQSYNVYVSINLSAREYESEDLPDVLQKVLDRSAVLKADFLKLEITESEGMRDPEASIEKMSQLADLGIELYIDDFGTGLSSLTYLKSLPAKTVKIDKSFIDPIAQDRGDREFLNNIINLAKSRNKKVIVEGVATKEQAEILKSMDCDRMQGYYFSKPVPAEDFERYLLHGGILPQK